MKIDGFASPGFEKVADAFAANFEGAGDVGANVALYAGGTPVVDLWAGAADPTTSGSWAEDTVVGVFSCSKGIVATLVNTLVQDGILALDEPVATYWPEFAAGGKREITVRTLLSHRAGLPAVEGTFTLEEALTGDKVVAALAAQEPEWVPGTKHGYHMRSFGWLTGELVRRATGEQVDAVLRTRVVEPLGLSMWLGMPVELQARCARLIPPDPGFMGDLAAILGADSLIAKVFDGPSGLFHYDEMWNDPAVRRAVVPSSGVITDARSLARMYAACIGDVGGVRLLNQSTMRTASAVEAIGTDAVLGMPMGYAIGYHVGPSLPPDCRPGSFGHAGAGGSLGFADPSVGLAFGYVMNRMRLDLQDRRAADLVAAAYAAL